MKKTVVTKGKVLKFNHFSRKGFSLFACLGKVVLVGVLSVQTVQTANASGIGSGMLDGNVSDTVTANREYELEEVEVSSSLVSLSQAEEVRIVTVVQTADIQAVAPQSINDLLKLCAGIDVRQRAAIGAQTDVSIRGGFSEHIAILLDGINISDPQTAHNSLDLPVQLSEIERVEIIEGPAARFLGCGALLGGINIVTKKGNKCDEEVALSSKKRKLKGDIDVEGGSYGYINAGAYIGLSGTEEVKDLWNSLSGGYARSDGFSRSKNGNLNNDYEGGKLFYQGGWLLGGWGKGSVVWSYGMSGKRWGSSTSYGLGSDEQYERTRKMFGNVRANVRLGILHIHSALYWQQNKDIYQWQRGVSRPNFNRTVLFGGRVKAICDWIGGRSSAALEVRNEDLTSTSLGDSLAVQHEIGDSEGHYVLGRVRTLLSLNVEHGVAYRRLSVSGGFMAHKDLKGSMGMRVYPGVDVSYRLRRDWRVYASWNTSMRMPSFTELYYSVDGHKADRNLKAERMQAVEIGSKYASEYGEGLVSLYYHDGRDMIDWIMDMSKPKEERIWTSVNHAQIHSFGIELSGRLDFTKLCPSWRVLKSISLGYSHIWQKQKKEGKWLSRYALEYLRNKLVAATHFRIYESRGRRQSADVWLHYRLNDRVGEYTDAAGKVHGYEPYSVLDVHARWRMRYVDFHIEANNILNKKYVDYGNVVQPGIWIIGGVRAFF